MNIVVIIHLKRGKETNDPQEFSVIITEKYLIAFGSPQKSLQLTISITTLTFSHSKLSANRNYVETTQMWPKSY